MQNLKILDSNPASINLNYNKIQQYKSKTGGFLSLCYFVIALFIFVFKLIDLLEKNNLTYEQIVTKQNDQTPLDISSGKFRFFFYQILNKTPHKIQFERRFQKGINVSIVEFSLYIQDEKQIVHESKYPMIECPGLYGNQSKYYFCSPHPNKKTNYLNYSIFGRVDFPVVDFSKDQNPYRQYMFIVQPCDKKKDSQCVDYKGNIIPFFTFNNNKITPNHIQHNKAIVKSEQVRQFQTRAPLQINNSIDMELDFQKIIIRTENSILPQIFNRKSKDFEQSTTWFFDEQINQFYSIPHSAQDKTLLNVQIRRSIYTRKYVRKYKKFDFVLAQIFGLLGLFSGIIFFLYRGYNEYCLEQKIRKDLGLPYDKEADIFRYYRYQITKIIYQWLPCCFKYTDGYLQQKNSLLKVSKKLDVSTLSHQNLNSRILQQS